MRRRFAPLIGLVALSVGTLLLPAESRAQGLDVSGEGSIELRVFPRGAGFGDQDDARLSPSLKFEPELVYEWAHGTYRVTATPYFRLDAHDSGRTHIDFRELGLLRFGSGWTLFAGVGKVFWGVTESRHLVDIVNQTDAVEDLDGEDKLGQPMVNLTLEGAWGALDLFYLPMSRERTLPGDDARLRGALPFASESMYTSGAGRYHQDWAVRWSQVLGNFDIGVSFFRGTSREPGFEPVSTDGGPELRPRYDVIDQTGLDLQWTRDATLWKLEAMTRGGHGGRFAAAVAGVEHTLYQIGGGDSDLGLLAEFLYDGRDETAPPTIFDNDLFLGLRWAWNDVADTSIVGGPIVDTDTGETFVFFEAKRRIGASWTVELEGRWFAGTDENGPADGLRRDGHLTLRLRRYF